MSHDQSPARVRVMGSRDAAPSRRRGDAAPAVIDSAPRQAQGSAPTAPTTQKSSRRLLMALVVLFLFAAAVTGIAVARGLA